MFQEQCHCGNVQLIAQYQNIDRSIYHKLGALWAYFTEDETQVTVGKHPIKRYSWDKKEIDFHHCTHCGCTPHYISTTQDGKKRVAINARMAPIEQTENIPVRLFDGAKSWQYLN